MAGSIKFKRFDPLEQTPPWHPFPSMQDIVNRARKLLSGRTKEEICSAADIIDWVIDNHVEDAQSEAQENQEDVLERSALRDLDWLKECYDSYCLSDDPDFAGGKDYEYFSVLTLWKIAEAIGWLSHSSAHDAAEISMAGDYVLEAMEAVCLAEHFKQIAFVTSMWTKALEQSHQEVETRIHQQVKEKISIKARKAAIKSHEKNHQTRAEALRLYRQGQYPSVQAAAQLIAGQVHRSVRTVADWIYKDIKQRSGTTG